jgi:hypothetical protein
MTKILKAYAHSAAHLCGRITLLIYFGDNRVFVALKELKGQARSRAHPRMVGTLCVLVALTLTRAGGAPHHRDHAHGQHGHGPKDLLRHVASSSIQPGGLSPPA